MSCKKCTTCNIEKDITEFPKNKRCKYGVSSKCKECRKAYQSQRNNARSTEPKKCSTCHETKDAEHFYSDKKTSFGLRSECKACLSIYGKTKRDNQPIEQFLRSLLSFTRSSAKRRTKGTRVISVDIDHTVLMNLWNEQQWICNMSGVQLTHKSSGIHNCSIDRIDSSKGYTKDNIQLVSVIVQQLKFTSDMDTFKHLIKNIVEYDGVKGTKKMTDEIKKFIKMRTNGRKKSCVHRTKKGREIPFEIDHECVEKLYEEQGGLCAISGLEMATETNNKKSLSIDRIDSSKGYIQGNVQLVCVIINEMKNEYSMELFMRECKNAYNHLKL